MICPFARLRLLPENATQAPIVPRAILLHTAVDPRGDTDLHGYFARGDVGAESHFYIHSNPGSPLDGVIEQFMDTERKANANAAADAWAISVETEDNSAAKGSDIDGLTPAALRSYVRLCRWLLDTHPTISRRVCTGSKLPAAEGLGYHSMPMRERWDGQRGGVWLNTWTGYQGKTCPGDRKVRQFHDEIVPAVLDGTQPPAKEWDEMATKDEIRDVVREQVAHGLMLLTGSQFDPAKMTDPATKVYGTKELRADLAQGMVAVGVQVIQAVGAQQGVTVDPTEVAQAVTDELARRLSD